MEKRILVVCQRYWPENHKLMDICEGFTERGVKVDVLCGQPHFDEKKRYIKKYKKKHEVRNGVRIFRAKETKTENRSTLNAILNAVTFRISSRSKAKELLDNEYDRIFIYQISPVTMCFAGLWIGKKLNKETAVFVAELWPQAAEIEYDVRSKTLKGFLSALSEHYYTAADKLIVNSESTRKYFINTLKIPESKVACVPQSAERIFEKSKPDDDILDRFAGSFNIVYIGRLGPGRMFETVFEAMELIVEDGIKNIRLIIVGSGPNSEKLKSEVIEKRLRDYVFFEGSHPEEEFPKYLNMADALIDTRKANDLEEYYIPGRIASYMAAERPLLLAMSTAVVKGIMRDADCGYICEPEDAQAMYQNIKRLYNMTPAQRNVLGKNAKKYQLKYFNRESNIERLLEEIYGSKEQKGTEYHWFDE